MYFIVVKKIMSVYCILVYLNIVVKFIFVVDLEVLLKRGRIEVEMNIFLF